MSAFIVAESTINRTVRLIETKDQSCKDLDSLGQQLWGLNCDAVGYRYLQDSKPEVSIFRYRNRVYTDFERLKAADCWLYQCHEGNVPQMALYKQVEHARNHLALCIVSQMPEYKALPWE